jgi:hypothetical protein
VQEVGVVHAYGLVVRIVALDDVFRNSEPDGVGELEVAAVGIL